MLNIKYVLQAVVAFAVLLLMSCEHKELCYDCSRTIKIQVIFDWRKVSTQFRASPFERAPFSALNRVLLIN